MPAVHLEYLLWARIQLFNNHMQIVEIERLVEEEIESYDWWVIIRNILPLYFFKKNKVSFAKALHLEEQVFAAAGTESVIEVMNKRNNILLKIKIWKMNEIFDILLSSYDYQEPTTFHNQAVITQIFNDLRNLEASVAMVMWQGQPSHSKQNQLRKGP